MNTNDLPLKEKLAALIEAGRAAHPNVRHVHGKWGDGKGTGCALTFAALAVGVDVQGTLDPVDSLAEAMGVSREELMPLAKGVVDKNDDERASIPEILEAIRTNALPTRTTTPSLGDFMVINPTGYYSVSMASLICSAKAKVMKDFTVTFIGDEYAAWEKGVTAKLPKVVKTAPAKKVRQSAKTGATWPVAKGCYA